MRDIMSDLLGASAVRFAQSAGWEMVLICDDPLEAYVYSTDSKVTVTRVSRTCWEAYGADGHVFDFKSQWELLAWMTDRL